MESKKFNEWALTWVEEKRKYVKESTYANYLIILENHLIPYFGDFWLKDITKEMIQNMILQFRINGRLDGNGGLSDKTVKDIVVILKSCLRDSGLRYENSIFHFPPNDQIDKMKILDEDMCEKLILAIEEENNCESMGYAVCLLTGIRIGELCALQWKDIDFERKVIHIYKTLQRVYIKKDEKTKIIISMPKSKSSVREIPISKKLENIMNRYIGEKEEYLISGSKKYIEPRLYREHFYIFMDRNGFSKIRFHDLRHTFATRCIAKGGDCKTVSCLLGHSNVNITLNRYVHPELEEKRNCVELI